MTVEAVKTLLSSHNIPFTINFYKDISEFYRHIIMFPCLNNGNKCTATVIVIPCKNGNKNIEILFNDSEKDGVFLDLYFGDYSFELFDCQDKLLSEELLRNINNIMLGKVKVIISNDLKNKRWLGDVCFSVDDNDYDESYYKRTMNRVFKPRSFLEKLLHTKKQYEIYDYENYQCVKKG